MSIGSASGARGTRDLQPIRLRSKEPMLPMTGVVVRVVCPNDVKLKSGKTFRCRAVPENQGPLNVEVRAMYTPGEDANMNNLNGGGGTIRRSPPSASRRT